MISRLVLDRVSARTSVAAVTKYGMIAMTPRNSAPPHVMRMITLFRYSCVGLPGLIPGMNPPFLCRFSARLCCWNTTSV